MASYKRRQSSDYNQSVPETQFVPEQHAYQEKHFQPVLNQPVSETHAETEYGATVTPDEIESRADRGQHTTYTEQSDQPGEDDMAKMQVRQNLQNNSDPGTQYSTPDVSSGVSSGPGGFAAAETSTAAAATTTAATTTVAASTAATTLTTVATATAGVAIITVAFILPLVIGVPSAIIFDEISVTDTTVYYTIYFEDYEEDMDLTVSLQNNFTNRSHTVDSHSISVLEENLKPGMQYRLIVYGSMGAILDERTVTTSKEPPAPPVTPTFNVETAEFSTSDGLIHLSATLDDPNSEYSDFSMAFYDVKGNVRTEVKRVSIENFANEVTMLPGLAKDTYVDGVLAVECMDGTESKVLYEKQMTAYSNLYIGFKTPPRVINGQMAVECVIVDTESIRSNYAVSANLYNEEDGANWSDSGSLVDGIKIFENVPNYQFHRGSVAVTWDGEPKAGLSYQYNTLTLGVSSMKKEVSGNGNASAVAIIGVEMTLDDDFNYLVDSSGEWRSSMMPELESNNGTGQILTSTEVRRTGDNTYVAVFTVDWETESGNYLDSTLRIGGYRATIANFVLKSNNGSSTIDVYRELNGEFKVVMNYIGGAPISYAKAITSDGREIGCSSMYDGQEGYDITIRIGTPVDGEVYTLYFCDTSQSPIFRVDDLTFESFPVMTSATAAASTTITARAVFDYSGTNVTMPDITSTQPRITATGEKLTLEFATTGPVTTGQEYFVFESQGEINYKYHWKAEFDTLT